MAGADAKHEAHARLLHRLEGQAQDVERLTRDLDDDQLGRRVVEGKWSLKELTGHLWRVQQVFEGRLEAMLASDSPHLSSWNPDHDPEFDRMLEVPAREIVASFLGHRKAFLERLARLSPAQWHRPGRHPDFPIYDVHFMIEYLAHHEAHHLYQMYTRRANLGRIPH